MAAKIQLHERDFGEFLCCDVYRDGFRIGTLVTASSQEMREVCTSFIMIFVDGEIVEIGHPEFSSDDEFNQFKEEIRTRKFDIPLEGRDKYFLEELQQLYDENMLINPFGRLWGDGSESD